MGLYSDGYERGYEEGWDKGHGCECHSTAENDAYNEGFADGRGSFENEAAPAVINATSAINISPPPFHISDVELRLHAIQNAGGSVGVARNIYTFLREGVRDF